MLLISTLVALTATTIGKVNFDADWKFALGHASDASKDFGFGVSGMGYLAKAGAGEGAVAAGFGDSSWEEVDLPHDWAVALPFTPNSDQGHGFKALGRGFPENSIGWYRKKFNVPNDLLGKRIAIQFDGIYRDAQVWLNGTMVKRNESGYIGFEVDLTHNLRYGQDNVISVRVDATEFEGWFYEGAGIYRHTWLRVTDAVHLTDGGQYFVPTVEGENGNVVFNLEIENASEQESTFSYEVDVTRAGKSVAKVVAEGQKIAPLSMLKQAPTIKIPKIDLWSVETPNLYQATVMLRRGSEVLDHYSANIGFRTLKWDADKGLTINGKYFKIKGTCNHQDHAGIGVALPDEINYWRIAKLKEMGCNAYRASHNPPTPELLDACDKLGMVVMDETRAFGDTEEARDQFTKLIRRDRNHPSVILWSIGNEEFSLNDSPEGERMGLQMHKLAKRLDPTRFTTYGGNNRDNYRGVNAAVDLRGFNYGHDFADRYHAAQPKHPVHGSEMSSMTSTRGVYSDDYAKGRVTSYDFKKVDWGAGAEEWWAWAADREWFIGGFVWTGFDYRGEPTPTQWPTINSHFGIFDTCGFPKDVFYYYQAWWSDQKVIHIMPHWNWLGDEGKTKKVVVYSNSEEVELTLNGKSLGKKKMPRNRHLAWDVAYEPGSLVAIGYKGGVEDQRETVRTAGNIDTVRIDPDLVSIDNNDAKVAVVNFDARDERGLHVPTANELMHFEVDGDAKILGVGNGDPTCLEPDQHKSITDFLDLSKGWKMRKLANNVTGGDEVQTAFDDSSWTETNVERNQGMAPNTAIILRKTFEVTDPTGWKKLDLGAIDDAGYIYINGKLVKETKVWNETHSIALTPGMLKAGKNVVAIIVVNHGGDGGFSRGAWLSGATKTPTYSRSLFNGKAQLILQRTGTTPVTLKVKIGSKVIEKTIFK